MTDTLLSFFADDVAAGSTEYTREDIVYFIAFGTGDPETDGQGWNFSRSFDDDWGVCTVREIQQATVYGGIESFRLHGSGLECEFKEQAVKETGVRHLRIGFSIDGKAWAELSETAKIVFRDCTFFALEPTPPN